MEVAVAVFEPTTPGTRAAFYFHVRTHGTRKRITLCGWETSALEGNLPTVLTADDVVDAAPVPGVGSIRTYDPQIILDI